MKKRLFPLCLAILLFLTSVIVAQPPNVQAADPEVIGISLNKTSLTLTVGDAPYQLVATVSPTNANQEVRWTTTTASVADVDENGNVTPIAPGSATIIATTVSGGKTAFCTITVNPKPKSVTGLRLDKSSLSFTFGGNPITIVPLFQPSDATNKSINWVSTNPTIAKVDATGKVTPLVIGSATIIATTVDGGYTATCAVKVSGVSVTGISLDRATLTLNEDGSSYTLKATISPSTASNKKVTWTSSNTSVATVTASGTVTPHRIGTAVITATTEDGSKKATSTVTVVAKIDDVFIDWISDSRVTVTWSGTSGTVKAELRKGTRIEDSISTSSRKATFSGLEKYSDYALWINGKYVKTFRIYNLVNRDVYNLHVKKESSSSIEVTWSGTSGTIPVDLIRDSRKVDSFSTSRRSADFDDLNDSTYYKIYISGKYAGAFKIEDINQVKNFDIEKRTSTSLGFSWTGTTGSILVELKKDDRRIDSIYTSAREATFSDLSRDTEYDIFIDGSFIRSLRTEKYQNPRNLIIKKQTNGSVELTWSGTDGQVEVSLYRSGVSVERKTTSAEKVTFTRLNPLLEYTIYIDGQYMKSFTLADQAFKDIKLHWAKDAIDRLAYYRILSGFNDGTFRPDQSVTREQFVTMIIQAKGYTIQKGSTGFRDVESKRWSAPFIYTAIKQGILVPAEYGSAFRPEGTATREEMAVMLARTLKLKADSTALRFSDNNKIVNKALVGATVKNNLILGYPDHSFRPKDPLTRAAAAVVINQIYEP